MAAKPKSNYSPGPKDCCQTPPHALEPLLPYIPKRSWIWEPFAGEGLLVNALINNGYNVIYGDIQTGQDFFHYNPVDNWDFTISNPPFSQKYKVLKRLFEFGIPFALLVPFDTLAAAGFQQVALAWYNNPYPVEVLALDHRINFKMPNMGWPKRVWNEEKEKWEMRGAAQMATCWLTWGLGIGNSLIHDRYADIYRAEVRTPMYDDVTNKEI